MKQSRAQDLRYVDDPDHLEFLAIYFANGESLIRRRLQRLAPIESRLTWSTFLSLVISKLGKKLQLRQRAIATATVFFRRFYLKNSYCETDPFLVIAACCYVAAKAEESPVHIKNVIAESKSLFSRELGLAPWDESNSH